MVFAMYINEYHIPSSGFPILKKRNTIRNEKPDRIQSIKRDISNMLMVYFDRGRLIAINAMFKTYTV